MNKRGSHCAPLRAVFSLILFFPYLRSSLFFSSILSRLLAHFFSFFPFFPYLSHTSCLLVSLLHHCTTRINWELPLTWLVNSKKFTSQFTYSSVKACFTPHENMHCVPSEFYLFFVALNLKWPRVGWFTVILRPFWPGRPDGGGTPWKFWLGCAARISKSPNPNPDPIHFPYPFSDQASKIHTPFSDLTLHVIKLSICISAKRKST